MRPDMQEIIIDRPRRGSRYKYKDFRRSERGHQRGMKRPYGYDRKSQTDVLGPLERFLKSNVGRPWNKVWSEVCQQADSRTVVGSHLRDHVLYFVNLYVRIDNDGVYSTGGMGGYHSRFPLVDTFYVHPNTGLLCYIRKGKPKWSQPESKIVRYHGLEFYKHNDVWYEIETHPINKKDPSMIFYDSNRRQHYNRDVFGYIISDYIWPASGVDSCFKAYGEKVYATVKRQIGKRMIRKIEKYIGK
jgi:hypothetical protein